MTVTMNEGYFRLFLKAKIEIFLNYEGARSHHGGAGRITLISFTNFNLFSLHLVFFVYLLRKIKIFCATFHSQT